MPRAKGQVIPKGRGKWLARVSVIDPEGRRRVTSKLVEGTKKEAGEELDRMRAARADGRLIVTPRPKLTVDEWLDSWLDNIVKPSCRARTHADYAGVAKRYIRPTLGGVRLKKVTSDVIRAWVMKLREKGLAPRTVRMAHETLRNALEAAVTDRLITDNPARSKLVSKALPKKERREHVTVMGEDVARFLAAAASDRLGAYFVTLLFSGCRPEEAIALRWSDVRDDVIHVRRVLIEKPGLPMHYEEPKSATSRRAVAVPKVVTDALREHRKRQLEERLRAGAGWQDEGLIFTRPDGSQLRQTMTREAWKRILAAAELPAMPIYDLRHSCASLLLEGGQDITIVSRRLGHSTITLTADTYSHINIRMQREAAAALDRLAGGGA